MNSLLQRGLRKITRVLVRGSASFRSPLRVGIVGFGGIAPDHLEAYENSGIARVVGISDLLPSNLAAALDCCPRARAYLDYRQMLERVRPDVISICTWPQTHAEIVEAAANIGVRGILCEKPLALQLHEIETMRAACIARSVKFAGGHQYRFHPCFQYAAALIRSNKLGRIRQVHGSIKSTLANNGPHLIDTVRYLLGDPDAVSVTCNCTRERPEMNRGIPAEDSATGVIEFAGGNRLAFCTGDQSPEFFAIRIEGDKGLLEVTPEAIKLNGARFNTHPDPARLCRKRQFNMFIRWVKGHCADYPANLEQATKSTTLVLACYEAARTKNSVLLPLVNQGDVIGMLYPGNGDDVLIKHPHKSGFTKDGERLAMNGGQRAVTQWFKSTPDIGLPELGNVTQVLFSKHLSCTDGKMVPALERECARYYGSASAVASTSGTAALHVALGALNLEPGDEVITTPMTDMGTIIPILASNCLPIFSDVDPITGNLTAESIAQRITPRTRAVMLVHLFGRPADLESISAMLKARNISLIEDCSQAHAAEYAGRKVGTFGDFGCFSFQQSKQITCGDGGITLINRPELAKRAALFVDKGWNRRRGVRAHEFLGMNYRMTELQGAVALAQVRKLPRLIQARRAAAEHLTRQLMQINGVMPPPVSETVNPSWWMYSFRIAEQSLGITSDEMADALMVEGVKVRRRYLPEPIFEYEVLKEQRTYGESKYPFSAFRYQPPQVADFPGLRAFNDHLLFIGWSHLASVHHANAIASAVRKVIVGLSSKRQSRHGTSESERLLETAAT